MSIASSSGRVCIYFSCSKSLARTGDEGKSCTSTFVAAKTLPWYLSFRENFANGGVLYSRLFASLERPVDWLALEITFLTSLL